MTFLRRVHPIAGVVAFLTIFLFLASTTVSELSGQKSLIVTVKHAVAWGLLILIPAMGLAGGTGFQISKNWANKAVDRKKRRMIVIAINGLGILVPCALVLSYLATRGNFDGFFFAIQTLEIVAGVTNLFLMFKNIVDGFKISTRRSSRFPQ